MQIEFVEFSISTCFEFGSISGREWKSSPLWRRFVHGSAWSLGIVSILLARVWHGWHCSHQLYGMITQLEYIEGTFEVGGILASACRLLDLGVPSSSLQQMQCNSCFQIALAMMVWSILDLLFRSLLSKMHGMYIFPPFSMTAASSGSHNDGMVNFRPSVLVSSSYEAAYVLTCTVLRDTLHHQWCYGF
jgi:hypothetical protein